MKITAKVRDIISYYDADSVGVRSNLARLLMHGELGGSGRLLILPVDQGFEHGPARSFSCNPAGYDPAYHYSLAIDCGLSALAAPLGFLESAACRYIYDVPTILKLNSSNVLSRSPDQAITASVSDALRLGCVAVGYTIYPGADNQFSMMEDLRELIREAKSFGLAVVVWAYPRGGALEKSDETALDIVSYAAHMAALLGANVIKVKPPTDRLALSRAKAEYEKHSIRRASLSERVAHIMEVCFGGRRIVVFSGGDAKGDDALRDEVLQIRNGGASGSIIGRNAFQRPKEDAKRLLSDIIKIYKG